MRSIISASLRCFVPSVPNGDVVSTLVGGYNSRVTIRSRRHVSGGEFDWGGTSVKRITQVS